MGDLYPISNRPDSLTYDFFYFRRQTGKALGYGYDHTKWTDVEQQEVIETIDSALLGYYFPPPLQPPFTLTPGVVHKWSFMRPTWEFDTASGQREYPLPEDFDQPVGPIFFRGNEDEYYGPIPFTNPLHVMKMENRQEEESVPRTAAVKPAESTGEFPHTQTLVLHPTPGNRYKMQMQYQAEARRITEDQPHHLGGQVHGPGILAACLAAAEMRTLGGPGPKYMRFMELLAGNIARDNQRNIGVLGYNGNDEYDVYSRGELRDRGGIFYKNVTYGSYGTV